MFNITESTNISNYADDTTFHACNSDLGNLINRFEHDSILAIEWSQSNYMKLIRDKCYFLLSGYKYEMMFANIGQSRIWESETLKLLRWYYRQILKVCRIYCKPFAGQKLNPLSRICNILNQERGKTLTEAFYRIPVSILQFNLLVFRERIE